VTDPSKFTKESISNLWAHWHDREKKGLPIIQFIKAKQDDMGWGAPSTSVQSRPKKRRPYMITNTDDEDSLDQSDDGPDADANTGNNEKGKGPKPVAERSSGPPPAKKARVSESVDPDRPEAGSPASQHDQIGFLRSLSAEPAYLQLCDRLDALPLFVSSFSVQI
jgi:hypothetical protein